MKSNVIVGKVEKGLYKGKNLEIEFGDAPHRTIVKCNGEELKGVSKAVISCDAQKGKNLIVLTLNSLIQNCEVKQ